MNRLDNRFVENTAEDIQAKQQIDVLGFCYLVQPEPAIYSISPNPPQLGQTLQIVVGGCHSAFEEHGVQLHYYAIVETPNGVTSHYTLQNIGNGKWELTYKPTISGKYTIKFFASDDLKNSSPFKTIQIEV